MSVTSKIEMVPVAYGYFPAEYRIHHQVMVSLDVVTDSKEEMEQVDALLRDVLKQYLVLQEMEIN